MFSALAFGGAEVYCAPEVAETMAEDTGHLRADALRYGADTDEVDRAIAALRRTRASGASAVIDLGDRTLSSAIRAAATPTTT